MYTTPCGVGEAVLLPSTFGSFPRKGEPHYRPLNSVILIMGTLKKRSLILGYPRPYIVASVFFSILNPYIPI